MMEFENVSSILDQNLYEYFSSNDFDQKIGLNLNNLNDSQIGNEITKIIDGIEHLNEKISDLICGNHKEFIDRIKKITDLELNFDLVHSRILNLLSILNKLRSTLSTPYKDIAQRITLLNRLQTTCDLLRRIIRIFSLSKKLKNFDKQNKPDDQNLNHKDLIHKALWINEINQLLGEDCSLNEIKIIKNDLDFAKNEQENINKISLQILENSLINQDINLLTISLQIFNLFNNLKVTIDKFLKDKENIILKNLKLTFNSKLNQAKIWIKIENFFIELSDTFTKVCLLFRVLKKKRDTLNQNYLIKSLDEKLNINVFYETIFKHLTMQLQTSYSESQTIKQLIDNEYPKLFKTINEINKKNFLEDNQLEKEFKKFLQIYESSYLSRSLSILFDLVDIIFSDTSNEQNILNIKDIDVLIKQMNLQLLILDMDVELGKLISKNICQSINLFLVRCEEITKVGPDSIQIIGHVTESQRLNIKIIHRLSSFNQQINNILPIKKSQSESSLNLIKKKLDEFDTLIINIIKPFYESINEGINAILLTIHSENFKNDNNCSLYIRELHGFLLRIQNDYLKLLPKINVINNFQINLIIRCIELFLRHVSILRQNQNLDNIRRKLSLDCDKLEQVISLLGIKSSDLGKNYRILRSFKLFLTLDFDEIVNSSVLGSIVPYSLVIQYLISAYSSNDFLLPYEIMNFSIIEYSKWCDENTDEKVKLIILRNCLDTYAQEIGQRKDLKTFPPIYSAILKLLDIALEMS